ncbi:MAG: amidohydrolase family protein [Gemmatimonadota bacterium]|nr:MAG: amidohydrolase family protein [Gemmatimonadota bacterium]
MPSCVRQRMAVFRLRSSLALVGMGLLLAALPGALQAQRPIPPPHFAIQNARIVTGSGQTIDRGTIVMENGLITAVGSNARIPDGAWVIDGEGLTVYPGLIDAMSNIALPASMRAAADRGRGAGQAEQEQAAYSWGPEDRPATFTWMSAADDLNIQDDAIETWRNAGFTSVVATPERGIFPGQSAVINLAGDRARDMVVRTPVALRVNFRAGAGHTGFPNSLFGGIAYVKQSFIDAAHYDRAWTIYDNSPAGLERPQYDRALEPLRVALNTNSYVLLPGDWAYEVQRAVKIGGQMGVNTMVYGARQGYQIADEMAAQDIPVLLDVNWPEPPRDADPEADVALRMLRFRDRAPTTPAEFERAGVQFAFYSGGAEPDKMLANVRKSIALGFSPDAALRAFTLSPAELFGVSDRLGSLEAGKIANVIVTDGDLFGADTKVTMVFVDGRRFETGVETLAQAEEEEEEGEAGEEEPGEPEEVLPPVPMVQDRGPIDPADVTVIQNATILTVSQGTIENGSILIRDGKIAEIGTDIRVPGNAKVIDASGKYVTPGIIDEHSHTAADAVNEGSIAVSSMVTTEDVINPDDVAIYRAAAGGVTTASILHGSANPIGGQKAMIKMRWGETSDGLMFDGAPPGLKMALGENVKRDRDPDRYPGSRMGVMDVIRQALLDAQEYQAEWDAYNQLSERERRNAIPPRRDLKLEPLTEVLDGSRLVHAHAYRADETLQLMRLAEEFGFRIATLIHVLEGYKVADEIAEHGAGGSTFSDWWAYKMEAYDAIPYNAALMTERGVLSCINSDSDEEMRHLNQEAAKAMKWGGMSEEEALKLVTLNPAIMLGIDDRVGSIEVGKDADLVIYTNHPLSVYSVVEKTLIDGQVYFDREHDRALRQQLEQEKQALLEKEEGEQERPRVTTDSDWEEVQR